MDKYVTSGAIKKLVDLTKEELQDKDTRLSNIENSTPTTLTCENVMTNVPANVQNNLKLTSVQGQTLQNLFSNKLCTQEPTQGGGSPSYTKTNNKYIVSCSKIGSAVLRFEAPLLKTETKYTLIANINLIATTLPLKVYSCGKKSDGTPFWSTIGEITSTSGYIKKTFVISSSITNGWKNIIAFGNTAAYNASGELFSIENVMILEGDWTNKEVPPYFEGIQSVQNDIDVQVTGKNLLDFENMEFVQNVNISNSTLDNGTITITSNNNSWAMAKYMVKLIPNETYVFSGDILGGTQPNMRVADSTDKLLTTTMSSIGHNERIFTVPQNGIVRLLFYATMSNSGTYTCSYSNLQIEKASTATEYEPYKQPIHFTLPNEYELRSLPNGVRDTIENGKLIKRVGKYTLNGSESFLDIASLQSDTTIRFQMTKAIDNMCPIEEGGNSNIPNFICDVLPVKNRGNVYSGEIGISQHIDGVHAVFATISATNITGVSENGIKTYLKTNPITIHYQLKEPEIIELEPAIYNAPIIQAYTNGNIILNNTPIHPILTFEYNTGLQGKINQVEIELQENQNAIREMVTNVTGEQVVNERVNDLVVQDTNIKVENLKGNTVQNFYNVKSTNDMFNINSIVTFDNGIFTISPNGTNAGLAFSKPINILKTSTIYTVIVEVLTNTIDDKFYPISVHSTDNPQISHADFTINGGQTGIFIKVVTSLDDFSSCKMGLRTYTASANTTGTLKFRIMLLEGDWTGKEIPSYFTGIKSVNEEQTGLSVKSVGKNLIDIANMVKASESSQPDYIVDKTTSTVTLSVRETAYALRHLIKMPKLKENTKYTLSMTCELGNIAYQSCIAIRSYDGNEILDIYSLSSYTGTKNINLTFTTNSQFNSKDYCLWLYPKMMNSTSEPTRTIVYKNIQLEEGSTATEYEPYKESTITIPYTEPLRKLPNGVCDEVVNGKVIRRVGVKVVDGSFSPAIVSSNSNNTHSQFNISWGSDDKQKNENSICDLFVNNENAGESSGITYECYTLIHDGLIVIRIANSRLTSVDNGGMKTWLSNNPVTVLYELKTPIEEEIPEITLAGYKHLIFNNDIVPIEGVISYANSMISRLKASEDSNVSHSKTIADLCAVVDFLTLQVGTLTNS